MWCTTVNGEVDVYYGLPYGVARITVNKCNETGVNNWGGIPFDKHIQYVFLRAHCYVCY